MQSRKYHFISRILSGPMIYTENKDSQQITKILHLPIEIAEMISDYVRKDDHERMLRNKYRKFIHEIDLTLFDTQNYEDEHEFFSYAFALSDIPNINGDMSNDDINIVIDARVEAEREKVKKHYIEIYGKIENLSDFIEINNTDFDEINSTDSDHGSYDENYYSEVDFENHERFAFDDNCPREDFYIRICEFWIYAYICNRAEKLSERYNETFNMEQRYTLRIGKEKWLEYTDRFIN